MTEILIDLICFSSTNELVYYKLFLLASELAIFLGTQNDLKEFYGCQSENVYYSIDDYLNVFSIHIINLNGKSIWFLKSPNNISRKSGPNIFTSVLVRYKKALEIANPQEKMILGVTYSQGYSLPSRSIHSYQGSFNHHLKVNDIDAYLEYVGLLSFNIISRCSDLCGIKLKNDFQKMQVFLSEECDAISSFKRLAQREFYIGDIVLVYGKLGEIIDKTTSKYRYYSYRIRFLEEPMIKNINEDWFPAKDIYMIFKIEEAKSFILNGVKKYPEAEKAVQALEKADSGDMQKALRDTLVELNKEGILKMMIEGK